MKEWKCPFFLINIPERNQQLWNREIQAKKQYKQNQNNFD